MMRLFAFALLASAATVQAAAPAPAPASSAPATQAAAPKRFPGVSDEGNAVLAKAQSTPDPQLQSIVKQQRAARDQLNVAIMAPVIDIDQVAAAFRQDEVAQQQARAHDHDRVVAVLKQLPEEDRGTFLRTLMMTRTTRNAAAPAATPPTPRP